MTEITFRDGMASKPRAALAKELLRETASKSAKAVRNLSYRTRLYHASLNGPMPDRLLAKPTQLHPSSATRARTIMNGTYAFPGGHVQTEADKAPWLLIPPTELWAEALHGFSWLRDFEGPREPKAKEHVHWLISTWLNECGTWHDVGWQPHVIGRRLISWFTHGKLVLNGTDLIWRSVLLRSIAHQARHLSRTAKLASDGEPRMTSAIGLVMSGLCLPDGARRLDRGIKLLDNELALQILPDGGHISRNPSTHLQILVDLLSLKDTFGQTKRPVPEFVQKTVDRMAPMLRFFRHGDGRLALFNGATEGDASAIETILERDDTTGRPVSSATHMGYHRIKAGRALILVDTGTAPKRVYSKEAHAGCLSFEMSVGRHRLIVNCGSTLVLGEDWQKASRATAAHSTLTLADKSSARIVQKPFIAKLLGPRIAAGPTSVSSRRDENDGGIWLHCSHDGYLGRFRLLHERRLFLNPEGDDLRGEDKLIPPYRSQSSRRHGSFIRSTKKAGIPFSLRFHLHPDVRTATRHENGKVLLMLGDGDAWQFLANRPNISLEESIYMGPGDVIRRSRQIVVAGTADPRDATTVKWALHRLKGQTDQAPA